MKGLELSERYYKSFGESMLREQFPELLDLIAVGLIGSGSECLGYDDDASTDHDFEPGFCILLPDEDLVDRKTAFLLERAYAKLPREFLGYRRSAIDPVGGNRHGVIRMEELLTDKTGTSDGLLSPLQLLSISEQSLLEVTGGKIFFDGLGAITDVRRHLSYFPEDVRRKKLAGHLLLMGQSGQYNYPRALKRGDTGAAQLAVVEFVQSAIHTVFLLNRSYLPYYKWRFHALRSLPRLSELAPELEWLISSPNDETHAEKKSNAIERIAKIIADELRAESLSEFPHAELERHAYAVNDSISDPEIRNLHVLYGV